MTIMLRKEQKAASKEGKTVRKIQSNCHMITVERSANGNRRNYFQHTLFPKPYPLIRTNPARPYDKTTGHFHSGSLTFKMTEQKENERMCIQKEAHLHGYASLSCSCIV
ncbi:hypothetical protein DW047_05040 [Phocaeicola vulgatus]|jgi:hypothetical protein|uniref:Uncharacterized protein n=2 Tax=Phocaeicola vulgatus TaxID=821 RepID=A0A3E4WJR1_PHOVU|nr:hypothetical protein DXC16_14985 [Phocaeicola vulgatus]RHJ80728.1 hypothetical protein DW105_01210 [Phocaeicola vulgatus]RHK84145.1 hypothetical protein DW047_05040 [Phocaeicola vulgatus]